MDMEKQLEDQRAKYQKDLEKTKAVAASELKAVLEEESRKRAEKQQGIK